MKSEDNLFIRLTGFSRKFTLPTSLFTLQRFLINILHHLPTLGFYACSAPVPSPPDTNGTDRTGGNSSSTRTVARQQPAPHKPRAEFARQPQALRKRRAVSAEQPQGAAAVSVRPPPAAGAPLQEEPRHNPVVEHRSRSPNKRLRHRHPMTSSRQQNPG